MKKKFVVVLTSLVIMLGAYKFFYSKEDYKVIEAHGDFAMDVTSEEEVVGNSENIFVAKVLEEVGNKSPHENMPKTQFKVAVVQNIKGKLKKEQIINQDAGFTTINGEKTLVKFENQDLLQPGELYLFATLHDDKNDWHNPVPVYGEILIDNNKKNADLVARYKSAFKNQKISEIMKRHKDLDLVNGLNEE
jgi:NhaP-type Na+/H+ and K+/H+ antiporter